VFQLASIDPNTPTPRVRSHIFRAFLAPSSTPSAPLILTTTDIRTPKVTQFTSNPHVELAWWIEGTQEQYRISGLANVIPYPTHPLYRHFSDNIQNAPKSSALAILSKEGFQWEEKRVETFKGMSEHMKASWCRPIPGSRLQGGEAEVKKWPVKLEVLADGDEEEAKQNWETALCNFALLIVDPTEVDFVQLGVVPNRRTRFWKTSDGVWKEEDLVP
jgi:pyridoxamine 5'-phosphate oxidase